MNAAQIVADVSTSLVMRRVGQARALAPLDLSREPELAAMLRSVDVEDLAHDHLS